MCYKEIAFNYKFGFSISSKMSRVAFQIFLFGNNQEFNFVKNNDIYMLKEDNVELLYQNLGKTYHLYISERIKDKVVYLNRTSIIFIDILFPEYVIFFSYSLSI